MSDLYTVGSTTCQEMNPSCPGRRFRVRKNLSKKVVKATDAISEFLSEGKEAYDNVDKVEEKGDAVRPPTFPVSLSLDSASLIVATSSARLSLIFLASSTRSSHQKPYD